MSEIETRDRYIALEATNGKISIIDTEGINENIDSFSSRNSARKYLEKSERISRKTAGIVESVAKIALVTTVFIAGKESVNKSPKKALPAGIVGASAFVGLSLIGIKLHSNADNEGLKRDAVDDLALQKSK